VRSTNSEVNGAVEVERQAESLIKSLKGVRDARVHMNADASIARIDLVCAAGDERVAARNVHSALIAVLGITLQPGMLNFPTSLPKVDAPAAQLVTYTTPELPLPKAMIPTERHPQVLEISGAARRTDLNVAARTAFDTLRAAQSSFHGFVFDGAEVVTISGAQYIVVAVSRTTTEARYCGAAPIIDSVSTASARALMNAVGVAAMGAPALEFAAAEEIQLGMLKA
jgi:hypothetical protein